MSNTLNTEDNHSSTFQEENIDTSLINTSPEVNSGSTADPTKKPYMVFCAEDVVCETPIPGLKFDFNYGLRVQIPSGDYRVRFVDTDACLALFDSKVSGTLITSTKKYFLQLHLEVYEGEKLVFEHDLDLKGKNVLIKFPTGILGDVLAWVPYVEVFRKKHDCKLYCAMADDMCAILKASYPEITFIEHDKRPENVYATYYMGIFFPCDDRVHQPLDFRINGLHQNAAHILGLTPKEERVKLLPKDKTRKIKEPYVCIAAQSSSQAKYWNNGRGWINTVEYLKNKGYRVLCIDRDSVTGYGSRYNIIPYGAENFTGDIPLQERIDLLYHADFFVGLSSGLTWIAWGVGKPVVLISGFTLPVNELYTPYRVQNYHICNGCWNDTQIEFVHNDFEWCPRLKDTDRQYECSRFITPEAVNKTIDRLMRDHHLDPLKKSKLK